ncbi:hypothetical protein K470DRAFT_256801 [Piedraia hortae CBS 480.64]|uniref:Pentacotripeptide-repeat region of PRORP domain-containing protein n=1 Tax=Piedraia hortae CBS 480.64 TaxID=1314780 RepID=A0A6A7C2S9_9PEZI|nr:hypothetical protein K470DRAFT_256801 [Piedraia hortae CBS 480.64]
MLECTRGRLPTAVQRKCLRSFRDLSGSFWHHGAGNADKADAGSQTEDVFLDFLYPPHAIALIGRAERRRQLRWEKKNLKSLNISRGYASVPRTNPMTAKRELQRDERAEVMAVLRPIPKPVLRHKDESEEPDKSKELWDALNTIIERPRGKENSKDALESAHKALALYDSLPHSAREDVGLKIKLLSWLSRFENSDIWDRRFQLYHSIPPQQRTFTAYRAQLSGLIHRNHEAQAFTLFREALEHNFKVDPLVSSFLQWALLRERCQLLMKAEVVHRVASQRRTDAQQTNFWKLLTSIPHLLPKALRLAAYLERLVMARTAGSDVKDFCAKFFTAALVQEFKASDSVQERPSFEAVLLPKRKIRDLFRYLHKMGNEDAGVYEDLIRAIVSADTVYGNNCYPLLHSIVSRIYFQLRQIPDHKIPEPLNMAFLEALTKYWHNHEMPVANINKDIPRQRHNSLTVEELVNDWVQQHGQLGEAAIKHLMVWYARNGMVDRYEHWLGRLKGQFNGYGHLEDMLWTQIYIHARIRDLDRARAAFEGVCRVAAENGKAVPNKCGGSLLHAYSCLDDLEGAIKTLDSLLDKGMDPAPQLFHPVMEMMASRGDVDGVKAIWERFDKKATEKPTTHLYGSLLTAHVKSDKVGKAEQILRQLIPQVKSGKVTGPLTMCFNIILTANALRGNMEATKRWFTLMKTENIPLDAFTFAALMQVLINRRMTNEARRLLRRMWHEHDIEPVAFNYSVVMNGYIRQRMYKEALSVHNVMEALNIRKSISSNNAYLKARAQFELHPGNTHIAIQGKPAKRALQALDLILSSHGRRDIALKQPQPELSRIDDRSQYKASYFNLLVHIHGRNNCIETAQSLFSKYHSHSSPDLRTPISLLTSIMSSHLKQQNYSALDNCWSMIKSQADTYTSLPPHPNIHRPPQKISPARAYILTRPFRLLLTSLSAQSRYSDLITLTATLLSQGYRFDFRTWNALIRCFALAYPPLTLLAFTLCEDFLMPNFPGWAKRGRYGSMRKGDVARGFEWIRKQRVGGEGPQYRTFVALGASLLRLGRLEGLKREKGSGGSVGEVRRRAPRTVAAVEAMPRVEDRAQRSLLGRG